MNHSKLSVRTLTMLALLTALFWGALPLALKHLLSTVDALSIVCLRFWVAAAWTWGLSCRHPGNSTPLGRREKILLVLAAAGLSCNFVFFNSSVAYLSASACQILAQAGPVLLLLGSVFVLREPFLPIQGGSVIVLLGGLLLFFNTRLLELAAPLELPPPSAREQQFQALWTQFYKTLEIKARHNEKGRMTHCPKRFWGDMVEMKEELQ